MSIDLISVIQNEQEVHVSQFVNNLEYVPLEMTPESGITHLRKLYLTDKYIIVRNDSPEPEKLLLLFDRKSGKYIRHIGRRGMGPEEYSIPLDCFYSKYDNMIYTYGNMKSSVKIFSLEGEYLESFVTPVPSKDNIPNNKNLPIDAFLDSGNYVGYIKNSTGQEPNKLVFFSGNQIINSFPHYETWSSDGSGKQYISIEESLFFTWEDQISFKERSNDTLFYLASDKLTPRLVFNSGNLRYPDKLSREEAIEQMTKPKDYFDVRNIFENSNYLFFDLGFKYEAINNNPGSFNQIHNFCIYDKTTKNTISCKKDEDKNSCLIDDINKFLPIEPISISENNELVSVLQANEIIKWKSENPAKYSGLVAKLTWLDNIHELDNPVIVIGKCK